ncbi:hypothetical protein [Afifella sp. YEN Y35]|uniref:hypothetical protein n=1 Tax=Afifella sp. YEN Y35 TaxID=3388337 RepID=UPI0039DFC622
MADRRGMKLVRSRRRDPEAIDYGCYYLADIDTNGVVFGIGAHGRPSADLDEIERFLTEGSRQDQ